MTEALNISQEWGTLNEVGDGLFRLRLFNPRGALMINTWIYQGPTGLVVFDPGWPWTRDGLEAGLKILGGSVQTVTAWLYTHTHVDHMGLAAWLSHQTDAPHITWSGVSDLLQQWHAYQDRSNDWTAWAKMAMAEPNRSIMLEMDAQSMSKQPFKGLVDELGELPVQNTLLYEFSEVVTVQDLKLVVVDARGHDPRHIAFWDMDRKWLFAGDVVLASPTPIARAMGDDLAMYRQALDRLEALEISMLIPGHGVQRKERISQAFARSREFLRQYDAQIVDVLQNAQEPVDLVSLALATTPDGKPLAPGPRWWVHLSNLDSHLVEGVALGKFTEFEGPRYQLT